MTRGIKKILYLALIITNMESIAFEPICCPVPACPPVPLSSDPVSRAIALSNNCLSIAQSNGTTASWK